MQSDLLFTSKVYPNSIGSFPSTTYAPKFRRSQGGCISGASA